MEQKVWDILGYEIHHHSGGEQVDVAVSLGGEAPLGM